MISEDTAPAPVSVATEVSTASAGGGGARTAPVALNILAPSPVSLYAEDKIITPIIITNTGKEVLRNIRLTAETNSTKLEATLSKDFIEILGVGQQTTAELTLVSHNISGQDIYEVTITANVGSPAFTDSIKFFINLIELGFEERQKALEKLIFVRELFQGNPECLELQEMIDQAEIAINKTEYEKAYALLEAAVQGCKELVNTQGRVLRMPSREIKEIYLAIAETIALMVVISMFYSYYKKRKFRRG